MVVKSAQALDLSQVEELSGLMAENLTFSLGKIAEHFKQINKRVENPDSGQVKLLSSGGSELSRTDQYNHTVIGLNQHWLQKRQYALVNRHFLEVFLSKIMRKVRFLCSTECTDVDIRAYKTAPKVMVKNLPERHLFQESDFKEFPMPKGHRQKQLFLTIPPLGKMATQPVILPFLKPMLVQPQDDGVFFPNPYRPEQKMSCGGVEGASCPAPTLRRTHRADFPQWTPSSLAEPDFALNCPCF